MNFSPMDYHNIHSIRTNPIHKNDAKNNRKVIEIKHAHKRRMPKKQKQNKSK